jgi:hypothetical protein
MLSPGGTSVAPASTLLDGGSANGAGAVCRAQASPPLALLRSP